MKAVRVILPFLLLAAISAGGESLWSPAFKGYLAGSTGLAVGDALVVQINASSALSFTASTNDSRNLTLNYSGGSSGNIFSFLPQVQSSGTLSTTGRDTLTLTTSFPVVVTAVAPDGTASVQGARTISVQGKTESVTLAATVPPGLGIQKGTINFTQLANARLGYTTLVAPSANVLAPADLQTVATPSPTAPTAASPAAAGAAAAAATTPGAPAATGVATAAGAAPATAAATTAAPQTTLQIPDARKKELLLLYLNRLLDVVFGP